MLILDILSSICAISLVRVLCINNLDYMDYSYSSDALGRWSFLEPSLGVVNTCLPVSRPAFQKISDSWPFAWSTKGSKQGSSDRPWLAMTAKGVGNASNSNPEQLRPPHDHQYLLEEIATKNKQRSMISDSLGPKTASTKPPTQAIARNGIQCTTEWEVEIM